MPKKDMGVSIYSTDENKIVYKVTYEKLRNDVHLKTKIRQGIVDGKYIMYCNCNPDAKIEKKIDVALRIYDAKRDTHDKHSYNCAGTPIATPTVDGCFCNEDGILCIYNLNIFRGKDVNSKKTPLITAIKNIQYFIWNCNPMFHFKKITHEKIKADLLKNGIEDKYVDDYQNIILFHRRIFLALQENQIIVDGKDLSSIIYNNKKHKFKDLKNNELQFFQMIIHHISFIDDKCILKCINNFAQEETFIIKNKNIINKIKNKHYTNNIYCIAGFVKNEDFEKVIVDCETYIPSKRGLITTDEKEKILIDTFTDKNIKFKCVMNYEFTKFYHPMFILETNENNILYDLITTNEKFEDIAKKDKLAQSIGLIYRYWKVDLSDRPFIPSGLKQKK